MRTSIKKISFAIAIMPLFVLITSLIPFERKMISQDFDISFGGDLDDQDDVDPMGDNEDELDQDNEEFLIEGFSLMHVEALVMRIESTQQDIFSDHDREVSTPPPQS